MTDSFQQHLHATHHWAMGLAALSSLAASLLGLGDVIPTPQRIPSYSVLLILPLLAISFGLGLWERWHPWIIIGVVCLPVVGLAIGTALLTLGSFYAESTFKVAAILLPTTTGSLAGVILATFMVGIAADLHRIKSRRTPKPIKQVILAPSPQVLKPAPPASPALTRNNLTSLVFVFGIIGILYIIARWLRDDPS